MRSIRSLVLVGSCLSFLAAGPVSADDKAPKAPDFSKGALRGKVLDAATGKPVAGATVALLDKSGKVLAWTTTGASGEYMLATDCMQALHLLPSRHRGML